MVTVIKWFLAAVLGMAAIISASAVAPLLLVYFLYSRSLEFVENFRPQQKRKPEKENFPMSNLVKTAFQGFLK